MYKHILIPTDGSRESQAAAVKAIEFAKLLGAEVTLTTVTAPWQSIAVGEVAVVLSQKDYETRSETNAWAFLNELVDVAKGSGVKRNAVHLHNSHPWRAIAEFAEKSGCDLIAMGSHGRGAIERLFVGSETLKVITHTRVPVLVLRV